MVLLTAGRVLDCTSVYKYIFVDEKGRIYMISPSFVFSEEFINNSVILNCNITKSTDEHKGSISGINGFEISQNTIQKSVISNIREVFDRVNRDFIPYAHQFKLKRVIKNRKGIRFCDTTIIGNASGLNLGDNCQVIGGVARSNDNNTGFTGGTQDIDNEAIRRIMEAEREAEREAEKGTSSRGSRNILGKNKIKGSNNCIIAGDSDDDYSIITEDEHGNKIMNHEGDGIDTGSSGFKGIFNMFKRKNRM